MGDKYINDRKLFLHVKDNKSFYGVVLDTFSAWFKKMLIKHKSMLRGRFRN